MGLIPNADLLAVTVLPGDAELRVGIVSRAPRRLTFADALYGAKAYTFAGREWRRVDTAEIRAQVAPLLRPGEQATFSLPVEAADSYRVLVPVEDKAAWGDSA